MKVSENVLFDLECSLCCPNKNIIGCIRPVNFLNLYMGYRKSTLDSVLSIEIQGRTRPFKLVLLLFFS